MNERSSSQGEVPVNCGGRGMGSEDDEISLLDLLLALARHKVLIVGMTLGIMVVTAGISLILPKIYRAETTLLPPKSASLDSALVEAVAGGGALAALTGKSSPGDLYIGLLKSRGVMDRILERFDLQRALEKTNKRRGEKGSWGYAERRYGPKNRDYSTRSHGRRS